MPGAGNGCACCARCAGWYGLRAWIEQGFKITKRAGWQWQRTQMTKPERAARLWLVSVFRRGWHLILVALLDQAPLPLGRFVPEPWPAVPAQQTPSLPVPALPQAA